MKTKRKITTFPMALLMMAIVVLIQVLVGCNATNATKGGAIGAGTGGAIGAVIGHSSDNTAVGAIIGATVGGTVGALIGNHMDKQAEELKKDLEGADVQRVGEGILITFNSGLQFDVGGRLPPPPVPPPPLPFPGFRISCRQAFNIKSPAIKENIT